MTSARGGMAAPSSIRVPMRPPGSQPSRGCQTRRKSTSAAIEAIEATTSTSHGPCRLETRNCSAANGTPAMRIAGQMPSIPRHPANAATSQNGTSTEKNGSCRPTMPLKAWRSRPLTALSAMSGVPSAPNATGAVLAMSERPDAARGAKPRPMSSAPVTATGVPKPAAPSKNAPNANATSSSCSRASVVTCVMLWRSVAKRPRSAVSWYRKMTFEHDPPDGQQAEGGAVGRRWPAAMPSGHAEDRRGHEERRAEPDERGACAPAGAGTPASRAARRWAARRTASTARAGRADRRSASRSSDRLGSPAQNRCRDCMQLRSGGVCRKLQTPPDLNGSVWRSIVGHGPRGPSSRARATRACRSAADTRRRAGRIRVRWLDGLPRAASCRGARPIGRRESSRPCAPVTRRAFRSWPAAAGPASRAAPCPSRTASSSP